MRVPTHLPYALPLVPRYLAIIQCLDIARTAFLLVEAKGAQLDLDPGCMGASFQAILMLIRLNQAFAAFDV
jgi:hypothetical protein